MLSFRKNGLICDKNTITLQLPWQQRVSCSNTPSDGLSGRAKAYGSDQPKINPFPQYL